MKKKFFKSDLTIGFTVMATAVVASMFIMSLWFKPKVKPPITYHGPNPNTKEAMMAEENVLGRSTIRRRYNTPTPRPTAIPTKVVIATVQPTPSPVPIQPVDSNTGFGIAAGGGLPFLNEKDLNTYFENLKTLGTKWVRWDFDWNVIQNENASTYDWTGMDRVVSTADKYGIKTLGIITYTPKWARDSRCSSRFSCQPADANTFGNFAGKVAERYKDSVTAWEIWNEPNYSFFWGPSPSVEKYLEVLKAAYGEIKKANPKALVITGGLSASEDDIKGNLSPITFIETLYQLNGKTFFDGIALHPYTYPASPDNLALWNHWTDIMPIHNMMASNGDGSKRIWLTEFGVATGGPGVAFNADQISGFNFGKDFMSMTAQSLMVTEAVTFYKKYSEWLGPFFWYSLRDEGTSTNTPENFFGLLRNDWSQKPAFSVYKNLIN